MKRFGKFCNPQKEIKRIEGFKKDYDIVVEQKKDEKTLGVYFRRLQRGSMFPVLECIGKYTNYSKRTKKLILDKADEVKYVR